MVEEKFLSKYEIIEKEFDKKDLYVNEIFGELKILDIIYAVRKDDTKRKFIFAKCKCCCEKIAYTELSHLIKGDVISCGCIRLDKTAKNKIKKGCEKYVGMQFTTNEGYTIEITEFRGRHDVTIRFVGVENEYATISTIQNIKKGQIRYPYNPNEYGGYYGVGNYSSRINNKKTKCYSVWIGILSRCNSNKHSSYRNVKVCKEWLNFQNFADWYHKNIYPCDLRLDIDKDILSYYHPKREKEYSPKNCIFIPVNLNCIMTSIYDKSPEEILSKINAFKSYLPENVYARIINYYHSEGKLK